MGYTSELIEIIENAISELRVVIETKQIDWQSQEGDGVIENIATKHLPDNAKEIYTDNKGRLIRFNYNWFNDGERNAVSNCIENELAEYIDFYLNN